MIANIKKKINDQTDYTVDGNEINNLSNDTDLFKLAKHQKKLEKTKEKEKDKSSSKKKVFGESARRLRLLRDVLDITAAEMAAMCKFNHSKYTRLENGLTQLTKHDATCICISVLKKYQLIIEPEWLILEVSQTPASLINMKQVQQKVQEYTDNVLDNTKTSSGAGSTIGISLEMEYLSRIYDKDKTGMTKFIMVNDNRLFPQYQKGDYVGGIVVPRELWYCLKGRNTCIVEFEKDQRAMVRDVSFPGAGANASVENSTKQIILSTHTREPELFSQDDILSIAVIFYHRHNSEELASLLDLVQQHAENKQKDNK